MTDDQMPARPAVVDGGATGSPAEGTAQGEAVGGAEGLASAEVVEAATHALAHALFAVQGASPPSYVERRIQARAVLMALSVDAEAERAVRALLDWDGDVAERDALRAQVAELESELRVLTTTEDGQLVLADAERDRLKAERDGLRGKVEAVRALHTQPVLTGSDGVNFTGSYCGHDDEIWPCPTIRALDGGEG